MIRTPEFAALGTLTALLGVISHLAIFTRIEWHIILPLLIWVYSALALLLFLFINSLESNLISCFKYLFILVVLYCMGLISSITIMKSLHPKDRPIQGGLGEKASSSVFNEPGNTCDQKTRHTGGKLVR